MTRLVYSDDSRPGIYHLEIREQQEATRYERTAESGFASAEKELNLKALLEAVVARLDNTAAIARGSYVHATLIKLVKEDQSAFRAALTLPRSAQHMSRAERGLLASLEDATA